MGHTHRAPALAAAALLLVVLLGCSVGTASAAGRRALLQGEPPQQPQRGDEAGGTGGASAAPLPLQLPRTPASSAEPVLLSPLLPLPASPSPPPPGPVAADDAPAAVNATSEMPPNATVAIDAYNVTGAAAKVAANETSAVSTIFAPTDAAFADLAAALGLASPVDLFNATLNGTAANITALHVIPGVALTAANITAAGNITATSLLGYNITVSALPNGTVTATIPGSNIVADVITPDVPFNGSIVHVINKVLLPPLNETAGWTVPIANATAAVTDAQPAAQKRNPAAASAPSPAASSPPVGIAVEALNATGVASLLNASTVATIFAPDNAAFISLASQLNMTSRYQLFASPFATNVTLLHIIPGRLGGAMVCVCGAGA
ncbi:hypothetical protein HYH02_007684 [Chlamydomonas schloesseri]|uniref:FAS1 domain-containing protein n=1 Tax=Chlamydomonas schloesseri TaxID=2026947 RepID=A0A835WH75_9CHLO|nr:hypothetical protein HYH02_007684 [Chlamydomonas schloesseri]|eukprot:KAG2447356.1 hypothetical protein HYH02_007684 [Chlamydomonas schloesseri]